MFFVSANVMQKFQCRNSRRNSNIITPSMLYFLVIVWKLNAPTVAIEFLPYIYTVHIILNKVFRDFLRFMNSFSLPQGKGLDYYHRKLHVPDELPNYLNLIF